LRAAALGGLAVLRPARLPLHFVVLRAARNKRHDGKRRGQNEQLFLPNQSFHRNHLYAEITAISTIKPINSRIWFCHDMSSMISPQKNQKKTL